MHTTTVETLTLAGAKLAAEAALDAAADEGLAVCVAVVNATGNLVLVHRMDNVVEIALDNSIAKAQAALMFKRDTGALSDYFQTDESLGPPMTARHHILAVEGGEPLVTSAGAIVGGLGISGAKHAEDVVCSQAAAAAFKAAT
ncbi:MAG: heme-binding protein [Acidimicrobiaceae bacterium]|nr:heme-binding protein [Acidimicrobiaceae bacterium]